MSKKISTGILQQVLLAGVSAGAITAGKANALDVYSVQVTNAQAVSTVCNISYEMQGHGIFNDGGSRDRFRIAVVDSTDTIVSSHSSLPWVVTGTTQTVTSLGSFVPPSQPSAPLRFGIFETDAGGAYGALLATAPLSRSLFLNAGGGCTNFLNNTLPVANAGPDAGIAGGSAVMLDGTSSADSDGDPLTYSWTQSAGPAVTLTGAATSTPSFTAPAQVNHVQSFTFDLVVSDGIGSSPADSVTLSIPAGPNTAPVANAGPDQVVVAGGSGGLNGLASSDFDNDALTFNWTQVSGPTVTLSGANTATPTYVVPPKTAAQQQMVFQLIVNDGFVDSPADTVTVTIPANIGPAANAGADQQVTGASSVTLDAAASTDGDGDTLNYAWSQLSGPGVTINSPTSASPTFTAPAKTNAQQVLTFQVTVDDTLASDTDTVDVTVAANVGPTADAGSSHQVAGSSQVTLDASGSTDGDGDTLTYAWAQISGPSVTLTGANTATPVFTAPAFNASNQVMVFEVTASDGLITSTAQVTITVPANAPPVVNAGQDQSVTGGSLVQMSATASDLENDPMTYLWTQTTGPTVSLANATSLDALFTAPAKTNSPQVLTFDFAANDGSATSTPDSVSITVIANVAPVADAGTQSFVPGGTQGALDGSASSDGDGDTITYSWTQVSGPSVTLAGANTSAPTFTAPARTATDQTLVFELEVSDGIAVGTAQATVIVPANIGPVADAGSSQVVASGSAVSLDASGSADGDGDPLTYSWAQTSGPTVTLNGAGTAAPTFTAPARTANDQTLVFEVTVSDGTGSATAQVSVQVPANIAPLADAGNAQIAPGGTQVTLDGTSSSDPEGDPLTYTWSQFSGPAVTLTTPNAAIAGFVAPPKTGSDQNLAFQLVVDDGVASSAPAITEILVPANIGATADAGPDQNVLGGVAVTLDASGSSDGDGDTLTYSWSQVSGPAVTLAGNTTATPSFAAPLSASALALVFEVEVSDGLGAAVTDSVTVNVAANLAPTADAGSDIGPVDGGLQVQLDGSASSDPEGAPLTYAWTQVSGSPVTLAGADTATPTFTAPLANGDQTLAFQLVVGDSVLQSAPDSVSVSVRAVGTITLVQRVMSGEDRSFGFSSDVSALNTSLTTFNGVGQISANGVIAGTHTITMDDVTGAGYALTDIDCNDTDSTINIADRSISVALSPGENLVCTFTSADTRNAASKAIREFLASRNELVLAHQPDMQRRLDRLNGVGPSGGAVTALGYNLPGSSNLPVQLAFNDRGTHAALSLAGLRSNRPGEDRADSRLDVWLETEASRVHIEGRKGDFQIAYLGADWLVSQDLLVGGLIQYDNLAWKGPLLAGEADGHGWMAGPYVTARLSDDLYADVRAAWGRSDNQVSPLGTWTDDFETSRALYAGSLTGEFSLDANTHLRPTLSVRYMRESQAAYADRYNVRINGQTVDQGDISLAPRIYRDIPLASKWTLRPYAEAEAVISFGVPEEVDFGNNTRGRFKIGADLTSESGVRASLGLFDDGAGADNYHSQGFDISFSMGF